MQEEYKREQKVKEQKEKLAHISAVTIQDWLKEAESNDEIVQLYPELHLLQCQVRINVTSKSLAIEAFPNESLSFSQKHLNWISSKTIKVEGILRVIRTKIGEHEIFLDFHVFDIPKVYPPFILIGRPIEGVINSVLAQDDARLYHLDVRGTSLECHGQEVIDEYV